MTGFYLYFYFAAGSQVHFSCVSLADQKNLVLKDHQDYRVVL